MSSGAEAGLLEPGLAPLKRAISRWFLPLGLRDLDESGTPGFSGLTFQTADFSLGLKPVTERIA